MHFLTVWPLKKSPNWFYQKLTEVKKFNLAPKWTFMVKRQPYNTQNSQKNYRPYLLASADVSWQPHFISWQSQMLQISWKQPYNTQKLPKNDGTLASADSFISSPVDWVNMDWPIKNDHTFKYVVQLRQQLWLTFSTK